MKSGLILIVASIICTVGHAAPSPQDVARANLGEKVGTFVQSKEKCSLLSEVNDKYLHGSRVEFYFSFEHPLFFRTIGMKGKEFEDMHDRWETDQATSTIKHIDGIKPFETVFHYDPITLKIDRIEYPESWETCNLN